MTTATKTEQTSKAKEKLLTKLTSRIVEIAVDVDGKPEKFKIKKLTIAQRDAYLNRDDKEDGNGWAALMAISLIDDSGDPLFTQEEVNELDAQLVSDLALQTVKANHMTQKDFADFAKNLNGTVLTPEGTVSPPNSAAPSTSS